MPEDTTLARDRKSIGHYISETGREGYASSVGETEHGISAIGLPIQGIGPVLGSLNIVFFSSAMTPEGAAGRSLLDLKRARKSKDAGMPRRTNRERHDTAGRIQRDHRPFQRGGRFSTKAAMPSTRSSDR